MVHTDVNTLIKSFRHDAHPMSILISTLSAYSTLKPASNPSLMGEGIYNDPVFQNKQIYRLLGIVPTIAAMIYRHRIGRDFNLPLKDMSYAENFLYMLDRLN
jgi:citrate synthase